MSVMPADNPNLPENNDTTREFICPICDKHLSSKFYLDQHSRYFHATAKEFGCPLCGKGFKSPQQLKLHRQRLHEAKLHACEVCGKLFGVYSDMRAHRRTHGLGLQFGCPTCGKVFASKRSAEDHRLVHTKERPYECRQANCGLAFRQRKALAVHLRYQLPKKIMLKSTILMKYFVCLKGLCHQFGIG